MFSPEFAVHTLYSSHHGWLNAWLRDRMLEGLKPKVRQAFLLAQCEGLTHKQIAEQMGLSLSRWIVMSLMRCITAMSCGMKRDVCG
jgi:hypothetical protein